MRALSSVIANATGPSRICGGSKSAAFGVMKVTVFSADSFGMAATSVDLTLTVTVTFWATV